MDLELFAFLKKSSYFENISDLKKVGIQNCLDFDWFGGCGTFVRERITWKCYKFYKSENGSASHWSLYQALDQLPQFHLNNFA
jgi:hypothetical protein